MFSTPVNEEFSQKESQDSGESVPAASQADQLAADKWEKKLDTASAGQSADRLEGTAEKKRTTKPAAEAKAPAKTKNKAGDATKAAAATKAAKQKAKQGNKKGAAPAAKKTIKGSSKKDSMSASESKSGKEEL